MSGKRRKTIRALGHSCHFEGPGDEPYFENLSGSSGRDSFFDIVKLAAPGTGSVLDIGANIGLMTIPVAKYLSRDGGQVIAFEPSSKNLRWLTRNVQINGLHNVCCVGEACGSRSAALNFVETKAGAASHIVADEHMGKNFTESSPIVVSTIDDFVHAKCLKRVDLIKIDVEGWEGEVLKGAHDTLRRHNPVVYLEFNSWCLIAHRNRNPRAFLEELRVIFEEIYYIKDRKILPLNKGSGAWDFLHTNLVHHGCVDNLVCIATRDDASSRFHAGLQSHNAALDRWPIRILRRAGEIKRLFRGARQLIRPL